MTKTARSAALYVRISDDTAQTGAGVDRQRQDCLARAEALGWTVGEVYSDNDVSAYQRGVVRPGWRAMLADLSSGLRDGLVVYDLDRVARQPRDLEDLLDLVESKRLPSAVVTGDIDLGSTNGRFMARLLVNVANKASADTARRVSRQRLQAAQEGRPRSNVRRQYGYDREVRVIKSEAKVVREMFKRAIAGEGHQAIATDLNRRGILSSTGKAWQPSSVRDILRNPMRAGLSAVKGEIVGVGQWEAIVTPEVFYAAQEVLATRAKTPGHNARKHLLTGFVVCGRCGSKLVANHRDYSCRSATGGCGRISRRRETVDQAVTAAVLKYLDRNDVEATTDGPDLMPDIERAQAKVVEIQQAYDDDLIDVASYAASMRAARTALETLTSEQARQTKASARRAAVADPRAAWEVADLTARRMLIGSVVSAVVISPYTAGAPLDSIAIAWR